MSNFLSRWANSWLGSLEKNNPEALYEAALKSQEAAIGNNRDIAATLAVRKNKLANKLAEAETELRNLLIALQGAVDTGDDETALAMLTRQQDLVPAIEQLTADLEQAGNDLQTARDATEIAKRNLVQLRKEKEQAIAKLKMAQAQIAVQEAASPVSDDSTARGLNTVRESIARLESQAGEGYVDSEGNSVRGRAEAYGRQAAEDRARAQLAALKRKHGKGDQRKTDLIDEPEESDPLDDAPDVAPKRTL